MTTASPIAAILRAEAILRASGDPAGLAVADGLARHVHEGASLPHALGLVRYGAASHRATEGRVDRDSLLRDLHRRYFLDLAAAPAARAILAALERQRRARGRVGDDLARRLEALLTFYPPVPKGVRQVRRILAFNTSF